MLSAIQNCVPEASTVSHFVRILLWGFQSLFNSSQSNQPTASRKPLNKPGTNKRCNGAQQKGRRKILSIQANEIRYTVALRTTPNHFRFFAVPLHVNLQARSSADRE